jgi:hypothetical protein
MLRVQPSTGAVLGVLYLATACIGELTGGLEEISPGAPDAPTEVPAGDPATIELVEPIGPLAVTDLVLLRGRVDRTVEWITVDHADETVRWPVTGGEFKVLVRLAADGGPIQLSAPGHSPRALALSRIDPGPGPAVRMVYIVASDSSGEF